MLNSINDSSVSLLLSCWALCPIRSFLIIPYIFIFSRFALLWCVCFSSSPSSKYCFLSSQSSAVAADFHTGKHHLLTFFFLKNHIIQHNLLHPCMYYMWKTHGMWSVMWLPLTVSRWQNALRDKRRSITGAVWHSEGQHALQVRAAQLSFKDIAVASLSHPILSLLRMKLRPPLEKQIQPYYRARIYSTALSESISFKWLCCVWGISVEF